MKTLFSVLLILAALSGGGKQVAAQVNYRRCLILGSNDGSWNCGFISRAQCQQTRVGRDMCVPNPLVAPTVRPAR